MKHKLSIGTVERLVRYYRYVDRLEVGEQGYVSSDELGCKTGNTPAQVRKDLTSHGTLGIPGKGYPVESLRAVLRDMFGKHEPRLVGLVGVGHLGLALLRYPDFREHGFHIVAGFDKDPAKVGHSIDGVYIYDVFQISRVCPLLKIEMVLLAVPSDEAEQAIQASVQAGVCAILNFAPIRLSAPSHVHMHNVDLSIEMEKLSCRMEGWL